MIETASLTIIALPGFLCLPNASTNPLTQYEEEFSFVHSICKMRRSQLFPL